MDYKEYNDYELLSYIEEENEEANTILFNKYKPLINSIAQKYYKTCRGIEINDLIQEGMVGLSYAINTYKDDKDTLFYTYALTCIERKVLSAVRHNNALKNKALNDSISYETEMDDFNFEYILKDNKNPENMLIEYELQDRIRNIINNELTDFEKRILELKLKGLNYKEISELLNIPVKSVDNAIQRLRTKIKNSL